MKKSLSHFLPEYEGKQEHVQSGFLVPMLKHTLVHAIVVVSVVVVVGKAVIARYE